jgi:hypothetical protein
LASCKAHKQLVVTKPADAGTTQPVVAPAKTAAPSVNTKLVAIRGKQVAFTTFSGKAKAKIDIDGNGNDATLNVRIQRDKKIWVSVTAILGLEVGRALITPDSITVINKLQGVYLKKPFSFLYQYGGRQVNFKTLQAILIGNAIPETLADNADIGTDNANTLLTGRLQDLLYKLIIGPDFKVSQTNLTNNMASLNLQVNNSAFIQADGRIIPSQIDIVSSAGNKKANISLHYNNAEFDKVLEYPFSIPERYTPVN